MPQLRGCRLWSGDLMQAVEGPHDFLLHTCNLQWSTDNIIDNPQSKWTKFTDIVFQDCNQTSHILIIFYRFK